MHEKANKDAGFVAVEMVRRVERAKGFEPSTLTLATDGILFDTSGLRLGKLKATSELPQGKSYSQSGGMDSLCPSLSCNLTGCMHKVTVKIRVKMSPELEKEAGHLNAQERRELGLKLMSEAHQLLFSARIMEIDARPKGPPRRLPYVPPIKLPKN